MSPNHRSVLVVDDDELNLELVSEYLWGTEILSEGVSNGNTAMGLLQNSPEKYSAVLLDRMLPEQDGIDILRSIKSDPGLRMLPVIMQTARDSKTDMLEGLQAGAYYYLTKPYDRQTLLAIVRAAINDYRNYRQLQIDVQQTTHTLKMMKKGSFSYKTPDEARRLAALLANACNDSKLVVLGLTELMINAVEHGNLGIGYEEKTRLNQRGHWEREVLHRLSLKEHRDKCVRVEFERRENSIKFAILDQGEGFDWQKYLEISPDRALDSHGRGIAIANLISFDTIEYYGCGNEVRVTVVNQE